MGAQLSVDVVVMAVTALLLAGEAIYAWRLPLPGARLLGGLFAVDAFGSLCQIAYFLSAPAVPLRLAVLWEVMGSLLVSSCFFLFAARYAGIKVLSGRRFCLSVLAVACALIGLAMLEPGVVYLAGHGLGPLSFTREDVGRGDGSLFWAQEAFFYVVVGAGIVLLVRASPARLQWKSSQTRAILVGALIIVGSQLVLLVWSPLPGADMSFVSFAVGALPILWALPRLRHRDVRRASLRRVFEVMADGVLVSDSEGRIALTNPAGQALMTSAFPGGGAPVRLADLLPFVEIVEAHAQAGLGDIAESSEMVASLALGGSRHHLSVRQSGLGADGNLGEGRVLVVRDITEQVEAAHQLQDSEQRLRVLFEQSPLGICIYDTQLRVTEANTRFAGLVGSQATQLVGQRLSHASVSSLFGACRVALGGSGGSYSGPLLGADGVERFLECQASALHDGEGTLTGGLLLVWDLTEHKRSEALIERLSLQDSLTGLANRALLRDRLAVALAEAERSGSGVVCLVMKLDRFAATSEALGQAGSDELLQAVARRLVASVRAADTVARWGGAEFCVVMPDIASDGALGAAERLLGCFAEPFVADATEVWLTAASGIACYPADATTATSLLEHAQSALQAARSQGPGATQFYCADLAVKGMERLLLLGELHSALEEEQLRVYYQPQIALDGPRLCGCEALVRWQHPSRGLLAPGSFIALAEESGLIVPLGEWLLGQACRQAAQWAATEHVALRMAVNLSPRQFQQSDLVELVGAALAASGLPAGQLELELTETAIIADPAGAAATLRAISALGVSIALDDFGTGYSSLALLRELPIDRLKIDRSFVANLSEDTDCAAIARAVIELAASLGLGVVAEGVETVEQLAFLRACGCPEIQGYLFGRPLPAESFELRPHFEAAIGATADGQVGELVLPRLRKAALTRQVGLAGVGLSRSADGDSGVAPSGERPQ